MSTQSRHARLALTFDNQLRFAGRWSGWSGRRWTGRTGGCVANAYVIEGVPS